jgi:hypothetical protein
MILNLKLVIVANQTPGVDMSIQAGDTFNRLTVVIKHVVQAKDRHSQFWCECNCGEFIILQSNTLQNALQQSCGCVMRESRHNNHKGGKQIHGQSGSQNPNNATGAYRSYLAAKARCNYKKHIAYDNYGGRGIKFSFKSFTEFYNELGDRPDGMTIDRKDVNGNYESGNVRWATRLEQIHNRRT